ncbi:MAG: B12-binding domain-containing radical SAM protein [Myxococcota bacterium]
MPVSSRVLLIVPPFTQLNTPYPATAYLTGFLRAQGVMCAQRDAGMETLLTLFTRRGLQQLFDEVAALKEPQPVEVHDFLAQRRRYEDRIEPVIRFLQNRDLTLAHRICHTPFLPEGPRFARAGDDEWAFGALGITDRARHLCTLFLDDLADLLSQTIAPHFGLTRYGERLAAAAPSYDPLHTLLAEPPGLIERMLEEVMVKALEQTQPELVGFTVPFPGNLYGALRAAQVVKRWNPSVKTVLGGGYINTELRQLHEPRLFEVMDFVTLDDGERPLLCLLEYLAGARPAAALKRTFMREGSDLVMYLDGATEHDLPASALGVPTYEGLPIDRTLSVLELLNPMHRLWSDGRWNKLTLAHGCYWKKCSFCDVTLDYIGRYDPASAVELVDRIELLVRETGQTGFHFVDEAAPPLLLRALALELLSRGVVISWWGNIRFEKTFSPDLCRLLAASGCIAVSGGLEVASDRLLQRMQKGVTVEQVARVAQAFTQAGVMVHAYLMYGFPTQTAQETVDSLERVRQLFESGAIQSAYWHRFVATRHAPIGQDPAAYGIQLVNADALNFANNDLAHLDPEGCDHDAFGPGLDRALQGYMVGQGLEQDVRGFFDFKVPSAKVPRDLIEKALGQPLKGDAERVKVQKLVWLGGVLQPQPLQGSRLPVRVQGQDEEELLTMPEPIGRWLMAVLQQATPRPWGEGPLEPHEPLSLLPWLECFPGGAQEFPLFLKGKVWKRIRELGAVLI